jgi:hypothetical protein
MVDTFAGFQLVDPADPDIQAMLALYFRDSMRHPADLNSVILGENGSFFLIWKSNSWTEVTQPMLQAASLRKMGLELIELASAVEHNQPIAPEGFLPESLEAVKLVRCKWTPWR